MRLRVATARFSGVATIRFHASLVYRKNVTYVGIATSITSGGASTGRALGQRRACGRRRIPPDRRMAKSRARALASHRVPAPVRVEPRTGPQATSPTERHGDLAARPGGGLVRQATAGSREAGTRP